MKQFYIVYSVQGIIKGEKLVARNSNSAVEKLMSALNRRQKHFFKILRINMGKL